MLKVAFGTVGVLAMAVLVGCAGTPTASTVEAVAPAVQYTFQDPDDVPQERWSEAMKIARAMGILGGIQDVVAPEGVTVTPQGKTVVASLGVDPLVGGVLGAASPTTHVSSGASLALGAAFFVLGNAKATAPYMYDNVAFWVPESMANNAEEASIVAERTWREAREKAFSTKRYNEPRSAKFPIGHKDFLGSSVSEIVKNTRYGSVPFSGQANDVSVGAMDGRYYGPIYIQQAGAHNGHDKRDSGLDYLEYYEHIAKYLPEWSAIYFPPKYAYENRQRVLKVAPTVIHNGEVLHFIVPTQ